MTTINGHAGVPVGGEGSFPRERIQPTTGLGVTSSDRITADRVRELVAQLEAPFDTSVIGWRVTNTAKFGGQLRGQVVPYADPRAYTDRLNDVLTPAGWTRKYKVHTSPNFVRREDQRMVAKVFVTCEVTIFGLGSHSATGEEWADDSNAGTSAEAQAFKRACSCFGLGRYLYYFSGYWVDLDDRKRPLHRPVLAGWATPEGWREGLRPHNTEEGSPKGNITSEEREELVRQIEAMAEVLGKGLYRGILKTVARAWGPKEIQDVAVLAKVLKHMQEGERGLTK